MSNFTPLSALNQKGFTLTELLLVIGISAILMSLITINLIKAQHNTSLSTAAEQLMADIKTQQIKAINGSTISSQEQSYGISLDGQDYVLFYGSDKHDDNTDFKVSFDGPLSVSATTNPIVFQPLTGELASPITVTIENTAGLEKEVFSLNKYGIIYDIHN